MESATASVRMTMGADIEIGVSFTSAHPATPMPTGQPTARPSVQQTAKPVLAQTHKPSSFSTRNSIPKPSPSPTPRPSPRPSRRPSAPTHSIAAVVNGFTLSGRTLRYPLPSNPTPEELALEWLIAQGHQLASIMKTNHLKVFVALFL